MSVVGCLNHDLVQSCGRSFSADYHQAREKFRVLADDYRSYASAGTGCDGQVLTTDVAWRGAEDAENVCVLISGVHGVEGYCGSGVQLDWLAGGGDGLLAPDQAMLLVHAINPYGFTWDRRVTAEGCDLNRNFVDFRSGPPLNTGYEALAPYLLPRELEGPEFEAAEKAIAEYRKANGELAFQAARKRGQYTHPEGMFFGGLGPTKARQVLERIAKDYRLHERGFVVVIDVHTGLGPFGYGEAQSEHTPGSRSHSIACDMFGESITSPDLGTSYSVPLTGTLLSFWERLIGDGRYVYLCLEFGTFGQEAGRRVLRQDHWLYAYGGADVTREPGAGYRAQIKHHYYPGTADWQEMVLFRARQVTRQALEGMSRYA